MKKTSKINLFLELANLNETGHSRVVSVEWFVGKYQKLKFGNGGDWCRADGSLAKKFIVERIKNGNSITAVQLFGYNLKHQISKQISKDIVKKSNQ